ncbi:MAG TPA: S9 family peptidase, partial [Blastocatellia bacterium]|nr:S9 family peptidase [Blastocatellia bacterium]
NMISRNHRFSTPLVITILLSLFLSGLVVQIRAQSKAKAPISHEAMWLMKRVGAPVPSPDGRWVVFALTEPSYDEREQGSDLWIVPADGSTEPRRLTSTKGGEGGAVWSPDSRRLAFTAKREGDEAGQIYIINIADGGEAVRVTSLSTGARAPQWRPDGKALLFASTVYPGAGDDEANKKIAADRRAQKYRARVYDGFPIRQWDRWLDDMQTHVFVQSLEPNAKAKDLLAGTRLVSEPGFSGRGGTATYELDAVWTPDGQSIIFVATTDRNKAAYAEVGTDLYQITATGGEPKQLTNDDHSYTRPTFRPDDKALYAVASKQNLKSYNLSRLAMFSWPTMGSPRIITQTFDRSVGSFAFTPDSRTIYLTAEEAGLEKIYSMASEGGEVRLAVDMTRGTYTNLAIPERAASTIVLANWDSAVNPAEVVRVDPSTKTQSHLTKFNIEPAEQIDWLPLRHFWATARNGKRIHSMLALPPNFDENKKYPLLVLIHGGPHGQWRDQFFLRWNYHLLARPGYVVLMTNYTGSTGFGEKFAQEIQGDPFLGPANEINDSADEAIKQFKFIDGTRQAAGGASYGGHLANWMQATTTRYKCLIAHAGLINLESQWGTSDTIYSREVNNGGPVWEQARTWREQNPIRLAKNFRTPMLVTVGENDFRVPLNQSLENWSVLQRLQIPSRLIVFPEENHWIQRGENSRFFFKELHAWLKKYIGNGSND